MLRRYPLLWCAIALLVAFLGYAAWRVYHRQRGVSTLEAALAELDRKEPGWRLPDLEAARATLPEDQNSARVAVAASRLLPRGWLRPELIDAFDRLPPPDRLTPQRAEQLSAAMRAVGPALAEARRLAGLPRGRHHITYRRNIAETLLEDLLRARTVCALLRFDALDRAQAGDMKGALSACRATLNAGRSIGDEPLVISQLVRNACVTVALQTAERSLAQGEAADDDLAALQRAFEEEAGHPGLLVSLRGERAAQHEFFDAVEKGEISLDESSKGGTSAEALVFGGVARDRFREEHAAGLAALTRRVEACALPPHEQPRAERQIGAEVERLPRDMVLTKLLMPSLDRIGTAERRRLAWVRCTVVALAVERYRRKHGDWPAALTKLTPELLKEVPLDPFDGRPLRYRQVEDGAVVYSVGPDGRDDGGRFDRANPERAGTDLGVGLWDVKDRRRPPRAAEKQPQERADP
jgi:hypothetical protein